MSSESGAFFGVAGAMVGALSSKTVSNGLFEMEQGVPMQVGDVGMVGGAFRIASDRAKPFYFYGVKAVSAGVFHKKQAILPFPVRVEAGNDPCIYIGTFVLTQQKDQIIGRVEDRFAKHEAGFKKFDRGCNVKKQLAQPVREPASH